MDYTIRKYLISTILNNPYFQMGTKYGDYIWIWLIKYQIYIQKIRYSYSQYTIFIYNLVFNIHKYIPDIKSTIYIYIYIPDINIPDFIKSPIQILPSPPSETSPWNPPRGEPGPHAWQARNGCSASTVVPCFSRGNGQEMVAVPMSKCYVSWILNDFRWFWMILDDFGWF